MRLDSLSKHFESIGARVRFGEPEVPRRFRGPYLSDWEARWLERARNRLPSFTLDVSSDSKGEYFDIRIREDRDVEFEVLQALPKERHLLIMTDRGRRFLCGHDERHWFVAEVGRRVSSVRDARRALLPSSMQHGSSSVSTADLRSRRNGRFVRQGEWFFVPADKEFEEAVIHRDEPIQRGRDSKPHICVELAREGGETVYVLRGRILSEGCLLYTSPSPRDHG